MGINRVVKHIFIILAILNIGELYADNHETPKYGLFLSPESCFLLNKSKECDIVVSVKWTLPAKGDYCLFNNLKETPIDCWKHKNMANKKLMLIFESDLLFELRNQQTNEVVFKSSLKLFRKISSLRRKRRNPWSFY